MSCFVLTKAIRHLKNEAEWQEILAKMKEEEEPLPSYLFKVKAKTWQIGACLLTVECSSMGELPLVLGGAAPGAGESTVMAEGDKEVSRLE